LNAEWKKVRRFKEKQEEEGNEEEPEHLEEWTTVPILEEFSVGFISAVKSNYPFQTAMKKKDEK
jgi:hypothetical protein